jgi:hypothetical protein
MVSPRSAWEVDLPYYLLYLFFLYIMASGIINWFRNARVERRKQQLELAERKYEDVSKSFHKHLQVL